ncbi:MAG TPA: BON domain-containing protein [Steroidobacteraceae bacterium]
MTHKPLLTLVATAFIASTPMLVHAESHSAKANDRQITEQVKQKLQTDDPTVAPHVMVMTHDGVVTLVGGQMPQGDINTVTRDAQSVDGVVRVDNRLKPE